MLFPFLPWDPIYFLSSVTCFLFSVHFTNLSFLQDFPPALPSMLLLPSNTHTNTHLYALHSDPLLKPKIESRGKDEVHKSKIYLNRREERGCEYSCLDIYYCHSSGSLLSICNKAKLLIHQNSILPWICSKQKHITSEMFLP